MRKKYTHIRSNRIERHTDWLGSSSDTIFEKTLRQSEMFGLKNATPPPQHRVTREKKERQKNKKQKQKKQKKQEVSICLELQCLFRTVFEDTLRTARTFPGHSSTHFSRTHYLIVEYRWHSDRCGVVTVDFLTVDLPLRRRGPLQAVPARAVGLRAPPIFRKGAEGRRRYKLSLIHI